MPRYLPLGDAMPFVPFAPMGVGQPKRYIGRKLNPESGEYELTGQPYECKEGSPEDARCKKLVRRGDLKVVTNSAPTAPPAEPAKGKKGSS